MAKQTKTTNSTKNPKKRPRTAEEIRLQKRECERRRRARIKEDPALYEAAKEKDRARYPIKKEKKLVKLVANMTPREHRIQRKEWKERKMRSRLKQKRAKDLINHLRENTPDTTDEEAPRPARTLRSGSVSILENTPDYVDNPQPGPSGESHLQSDKTSELHPQPDSPSISLCSTPIGSWSPMLSNNSVSSSRSGTPSRQKSKATRAARLRRELAQKTIKKQTETITTMKKKIHTLQCKLLRASKEKEVNIKSAKYKRVRESTIKTSKPKILKKALVKFLERDDNSRLCPGKKDYVSKNKVTKQKRYLSDSLSNLHKKFNAENQQKISFASFCRGRPFWITMRKISERDTCLCITHDNMQLMFDNLKYHDMISSPNLRELSKSVVCDINSDMCMLRKCTICKNKVPVINTFDDSIETVYKSWTVKKETRLIRGKEKEIRRTVKTEIRTTKKELLLKFTGELDKFLQHQYYIAHQYIATTQLKTNLSVGDIFMHIDFAENYCCKYSDEIQAVHFGASRQQISLHTGVYYYRCPDTGEVKSQSFCTFSECLRHDASGAFAHIQKILDIVVVSHPITTLHVLSDGPTAQYRNKKAFFLFSQYITQRYGMHTATWNFGEAGHGKGPMDGVGAVVKRTADRLVAQGEDIPDFATFLKSVEANITNVAMSVVTEAEIEVIDNLLTNQNQVKSICGTLKIHQITWDSTNPNRIYLRQLTCNTCKPNEFCNHYPLSTSYADFISPDMAENTDRPKSDGAEDQVSEIARMFEDETENPKSDGIHDQRSETAKECLALKEGMWVIAKFSSKKTIQHFIGQVVGFEDNEPKIKFLKKKSKEHSFFIWIEPEDVFPVPRDDVLSIIKEPTPGRRGVLVFDKKELKMYNNIQ